LLGDLVTNQLDRNALTLLLGPSEIGRPFMAPPNLPPERTKALRAAFMAALKDPELIEEARKQRLDVDPVSGEDMQERVAGFYEAPEAVVARTRALVAMGGSRE
jgi:tripartite-type tricarboxylate transporter receptor subunit TctC